MRLVLWWLLVVVVVVLLLLLLLRLLRLLVTMTMLTLLYQGGYFVINGSEKVLIAQERQAYNRVYCFKRSKPSKATWTCEIRSDVRSLSRVSTRRRAPRHRMGLRVCVCVVSMRRSWEPIGRCRTSSCSCSARGWSTGRETRCTPACTPSSSACACVVDCRGLSCRMPSFHPLMSCWSRVFAMAFLPAVDACWLCSQDRAHHARVPRPRLRSRSPHSVAHRVRLLRR
jgi:hypothetical protein